MSRKRSVPIDGLRPDAFQVNRRAAGAIPSWARLRIDALHHCLSSRHSSPVRSSTRHQPFSTPSSVVRSHRSIERSLSDSELTGSRGSSRHEYPQAKGPITPIADTPLRAPNEPQVSFASPPPQLQPPQLDRSGSLSLSSIPPELRPIRRLSPPEIMTDADIESGRVRSYSRDNAAEDSFPKQPSFSFLPPDLRPVPNRELTEDFAMSMSLSSIPPELRPIRRLSPPENMTDADIESGRLRRYSHDNAAEDSIPQQPSFSFRPPDLRPVPNGELTEDFALDDSFGDGDSATDLFTKDWCRTSRNRKCDWRVLLLLLLLASVAVGVGVGVSQKNQKDASGNKVPPPKLEKQCNYSGLGEEGLIPNAFAQCHCDGNITIWTDDISSRYSDLRDSFILTVLADFDENEQSCDPTNTALWQLANDTLFNVTETDTRYILTLLYANWEGEEWKRNKDWLSVENPECEWQGVICDKADQVTSLLLSSNNIGGTIPSELALLTELRILNVEFNRLQGSLPSELFQLQKIERLLLSVNFLEGTIPSQIALLPIIDTLQLDFNYLSGTIPKEMGTMLSLKFLGIGQNSITGKVPPELGQLLSLETLRFEENALTGTLPRELGQLGSLKTLAGGKNFLRGRLDLSLLRKCLLRSLDLAEAGIAGDIPTELGRCTNLSLLSLARNNFVGMLPMEILNLTRLSFVHLSDNDLSGAIPSELGTWSNLSILELDGNLFDGPVPSEIGLLKLLVKLNLGVLQLTGSIPEQVCALRDGGLDIFVGPCETDEFRCSVPDCCTECES